MNDERRRQLAELLARLVLDGEITEEQAAALYLAVMDDGELIDEAIPLPPYSGIARRPQPTQNEIAALLLAIAGISLFAISRTSEGRRLDAADLLQDWHTAEAAALADQLAAGRITVSEFHRALLALNEQHNAAQINLGAGANAYRMMQQAAEQAAIQAAYLQRYADQIAGRVLMEGAGMEGAPRPFSAAYMAERAGQYGAIGRALFFQAYEAHGLPELGAGSAPGYVVRYIARDDARTCGPCRRAAGYYLPGTGPYPGQICLGRHHCRCRRVVIYNPARYAQLAGIQIAPGPAAAQGATATP